MAKEETLKEAWEKLPAWKKTWFKIIAVITVITVFISCIFIVNEFNKFNKLEKELDDTLKQQEQVNF